MLRKNILPLTSMVLVLELSGLATQVEPVKASTYGNGDVVTVPKNMQGTWYSYDRDAHDGKKITFGAHTVNGKIIYTQDKNVISDYFKARLRIKRSLTKLRRTGCQARQPQ